VNRFDEPVLMSNDCPVHTWRRPTADAPTGGIGVENSDEVRFPLTPSALLVMTRPGRPGSQASQEPHQANAEISRECHQFVIGTPQSKPALDRLELSPRPLDSDSVRPPNTGTPRTCTSSEYVQGVAPDPNVSSRWWIASVVPERLWR
jgi:hypothetical protein